MQCYIEGLWNVERGRGFGFPVGKRNGAVVLAEANLAEGRGRDGRWCYARERGCRLRFPVVRRDGAVGSAEAEGGGVGVGARERCPQKLVERVWSVAGRRDGLDWLGESEVHLV